MGLRIAVHDEAIIPNIVSFELLSGLIVGDIGLSSL